MNLLVVDDEQHVRDSIVYKIDRASNGIACIDEAEDGFEALLCLKNKHYDVIITDIKMPELDGLEFIKLAKSRGCKASFIIVSGYNDFEYARQSIRLGVVDYLLKPINTVVLNALIDQIRCSIDVAKLLENEVVSNQILQKKTLSHNLLNDYLWRYSKERYPELSEVVKVFFRHPMYRVLVIHFKPMNKETKIGIEQLAMLIKHKLIITNKECDFGFMEHQNHHNELAIIMNFNKGNDELTILQYIIRMLIKDYSIEAAIGIGEIKERIEAIRDSYDEAYFSVLEKMIGGYNKIYYKSRIKNGQYRMSDNKRKLVQHYLSHFIQKDLCELIQDVLGDMSQNKEINHVSIVTFATDMYLLMKKYNQVKNLQLSDEDFIYKLYECDSIFEVEKLLISLIKIVVVNGLNQYDSSKEMIDGAVKYIREHYDDNLTLECMASLYHIHPNYFSRIFKAHQQINFNEFVTEVRMEKAKQLLMNPEIKVRDVANILGYTDSKYFSKVFKKYHGVSPSKLTM